MIRRLVSHLIASGPILFGVGFVAPVFAALVEASGVILPFGIAPLTAGLGIGVLWGAVAAKRGSWI